MKVSDIQIGRLYSLLFVYGHDDVVVTKYVNLLSPSFNSRIIHRLTSRILRKSGEEVGVEEVHSVGRHFQFVKKIAS